MRSDCFIRQRDLTCSCYHPEGIKELTRLFALVHQMSTSETQGLFSHGSFSHCERYKISRVLDSLVSSSEIIRSAKAILITSQFVLSSVDLEQDLDKFGAFSEYVYRKDSYADSILMS